MFSEYERNLTYNLLGKHSFLTQENKIHIFKTLCNIFQKYSEKFWKSLKHYSRIFRKFQKCFPKVLDDL